MEKEDQELKSETNQYIIQNEDKSYVLSSLKNGDIDCANITNIGLMDKFFAFLQEIDFFNSVCPSYPNPRKRVGIPLHFLISAYLQLKLHVENAFQNLPYLLNSATLLKTLGFNVGPKGGGFNHKNKKPRLSAADQDTVRKFFKDTDAEKLLLWYNSNIMAFFKSKKVFDPQGIFILDSSLLPLPDNPNYENASWLPLDENRKYVDVYRLTQGERKKLKNTLCYNLTTLLNVGFPDNYFIFSGIHLGPGKESGLTQGAKIIDDFVKVQGKGIIKILLIDRGFIDGPMISRFKKEYHIDTVFPLRKNMDAYTDAFGIAKLSSIEWTTYSVEKDKDQKLIKKIEIALIPEVTIWQNCQVPLQIAIIKETKLNEETNQYQTNQWTIATTLSSPTATQIYELYYRRTQIEERYDQVKNYWNLYKFTSTSFNLATAQVVFILMAYSLLQLYLKNKQMQEYANRSLKKLKYKEMIAGPPQVVVYKNRCFALFRIEEYQDILLNLEGEPRERMRKKARHLLRLKSPPEEFNWFF